MRLLFLILVISTLLKVWWEDLKKNGFTLRSITMMKLIFIGSNNIHFCAKKTTGSVACVWFLPIPLYTNSLGRGCDHKKLPGSSGHPNIMVENHCSEISHILNVILLVFISILIYLLLVDLSLDIRIVCWSLILANFTFWFERTSEKDFLLGIFCVITYLMKMRNKCLVGTRSTLFVWLLLHETTV